MQSIGTDFGSLVEEARSLMDEEGWLQKEWGNFEGVMEIFYILRMLTVI